ncbi:hypothetical protein GCM10007385_13460 [Tateyamaria omphalii]|uniref:hypothetical protein n=1 Tax=Tateyamaria omphalii TaxID=299262 RepID=UPI0016731D82|nr:hypothetical protein [Tateyamaria omphalii]GGX47024.1 hypothetical protein GCM10007385_13460 [Tateyamaria omphalii]
MVNARLLKKTAVTLLAALIISKPTLADDSIVIDELNEHKFLSAIVADGLEVMIHHEVCNLSEASSGFLWKKAGMGVDALNQLQRGLCARRVQNGIQKLDRGHSKVVFQDGSKGSVETIFQCNVYYGSDSCDTDYIGKSISRVTEFTFFLTKPDENNVRMETITVGRQPIGGEQHELFIESTSGVQNFALTLNPESLDLEQVREILGENDALQVNTFSFFRENGDIVESLLSGQVPSESPILFFSKPDGDSIEHRSEINWRIINELSDIISILVINERKVVASSEVLWR